MWLATFALHIKRKLCRRITDQLYMKQIQMVSVGEYFDYRRQVNDVNSDIWLKPIILSSVYAFVDGGMFSTLFKSVSSGLSMLFTSILGPVGIALGVGADIMITITAEACQEATLAGVTSLIHMHTGEKLFTMFTEDCIIPPKRTAPAAIERALNVHSSGTVLETANPSTSTIPNQFSNQPPQLRELQKNAMAEIDRNARETRLDVDAEDDIEDEMDEEDALDDLSDEEDAEPVQKRGGWGFFG